MLLKMRFISLKRVILSMKYVLLIGSIICLLYLREALVLLKGPQDIVTLAANEIDESFVRVDLNSIFGLYMQDKSIKDKTGYEYVVSIGENKRMIGIRAEGQLRQMGETEAGKVRKDYMESRSFDGDIKVGEKYTYCHEGAKTCFFPTVDIQGLYMEDSKKQKEKGVFRKDLYIRLKDGSQYRIKGDHSGQVINYYKEFYPDIKFDF